MEPKMLICKLLIAATMLLASMANAGGEENYYRPTKVNIQKEIFRCEGELVGVDYLGGDLYLAAFVMRNPKKVQDLLMVVYNAQSDSVVNTELLKGAGGYRITGDLKSGVVGVIAAYEGYGSTWILNALGETVMIYPGVSLIVAGPDLMGRRVHYAKRMNTKLMDGEIRGRVLHRPGPFEGCDWDLKNRTFSISYLSNEKVVILTRDVDDVRKQTFRGYDNSCKEIWRYTRTAQDFAGSGELGGEPYAVVNGVGGSDLVSLKTGAAQHICTGGSLSPTFGNDGLFFFGRLDGASEFSINRLTLPAGKPEPVAPTPGRSTTPLRVQRKVLYAELPGDARNKETAIFSPDFRSAMVFPGLWRSTNSQVVPDRIIGGLSGKGILSLAVIVD